MEVAQTILENRAKAIQKDQKGVSLTTLIPHRKQPGLKIIPQELHLVVHTQYILQLHRQVVVTQQIRTHHVETKWGTT